MFLESDRMRSHLGSHLGFFENPQIVWAALVTFLDSLPVAPWERRTLDWDDVFRQANQVLLNVAPCMTSAIHRLYLAGAFTLRFRLFGRKNLVRNAPPALAGGHGSDMEVSEVSLSDSCSAMVFSDIPDTLNESSGSSMVLSSDGGERSGPGSSISDN